MRNYVWSAQCLSAGCTKLNSGPWRKKCLTASHFFCRRTADLGMVCAEIGTCHSAWRVRLAVSIGRLRHSDCNRCPSTALPSSKRIMIFLISGIEKKKKAGSCCWATPKPSCPRQWGLCSPPSWIRPNGKSPSHCQSQKESFWTLNTVTVSCFSPSNCHFMG